MTIKELAELTQISKETIRYYESIGLLKPARKDNGYRDYQKKDIKDLIFIIKMKQVDLSLNEISILIQLKNKETSLFCKNETLSFIEKHLVRIDEQLNVLTQVNHLFEEIKQVVVTSDGQQDEEKVISLLEKFQGGTK